MLNIIPGDCLINISNWLISENVKTLIVICSEIRNKMKKDGIDKIMEKRMKNYYYIYKYERNIGIKIAYYAHKKFAKEKTKYNKRVFKTASVLFEFVVYGENREFLSTNIFNPKKMRNYIWSNLLVDVKQLEIFKIDNRGNIEEGYINLMKNLMNRKDYNINLSPGQNIDNIVKNKEFDVAYGDRFNIKKVVKSRDIESAKIIMENYKANNPDIYNLLKESIIRDKEFFISVIKLTKEISYSVTRELSRYIKKNNIDPESYSECFYSIKKYNPNFYCSLFNMDSDRHSEEEFSLNSIFRKHIFENYMDNSHDILLNALIDRRCIYSTQLLFNSNIQVPIELIQKVAKAYKIRMSEVCLYAINYLLENGYNYDFSPDYNSRRTKSGNEF